MSWCLQCTNLHSMCFVFNKSCFHNCSILCAIFAELVLKSFKKFTELFNLLWPCCLKRTKKEYHEGKLHKVILFDRDLWVIAQFVTLWALLRFVPYFVCSDISLHLSSEAFQLWIVVFYISILYAGTSHSKVHEHNVCQHWCQNTTLYH